MDEKKIIKKSLRFLVEKNYSKGEPGVPLWGHENASKCAKYTEEGKQSLICKYNEHKE